MLILTVGICIAIVIGVIPGGLFTAGIYLVLLSLPNLIVTKDWWILFIELLVVGIFAAIKYFE